MRKDSIGAEPQAATLSIEEALNQAEALIESKLFLEAHKKLQAVSQISFIPTLSEESCRFHYLHGLVLFWMGEQAAAQEEADKALQLFRSLNGSTPLPEDQDLPDFVLDKLKQLRDIEISLLQGLDGQNYDGNDPQRRILSLRIHNITCSLEHLRPFAQLHHLAGSIKIHLGKLNEALEHLSQAITAFKLSKDWAAVAQTLNRIAQIHDTRGELALAIQMLEQAIIYCRKIGDHYYEMVLRSNIAHCQLLTGMWKPALFSLREILDEMKKKGDLHRYATTLNMLANANFLGGRLRPSAKAAREAQRIAKKNNFMGVLRYSYGHLFEIYKVKGKLAEAKKCLDKVLELGETKSLRGVSTVETHQAFGELYLAQKKYNEALKAFSACLNQSLKLPEQLSEGVARRGIAICYARKKQFPAAHSEFRRAMDIFKRCGNDWELAKTAVLAAENSAFAFSEIQPKLILAKDTFQKLQLATWKKKVYKLLKNGLVTSKKLSILATRAHTEREQIAKALFDCNGNISHAAKKLGILRQTLQYKIKHYGIDV